MKKILLIIFVALLGTATFAQEATTGVVNKKGEAILPVAGDISLGADALPFLNYLGNVLNGSAGNTIVLPSTTIYGRYYIADDVAIRGSLTIANNSQTEKVLVQDAVAAIADPTTTKSVEDKYVSKTRDIGISVGIQKSRGYGRLRGNYGATLNYRYQDGSEAREYGNTLSATNVAHVDASSGFLTTPDAVISSKNQATNTIGIGGILGVEYYFAPKMCIGAEVNLVYGGVFAAAPAETTTETWNGTAIVKTEVAKDDIGSSKTTNGMFQTFGFGCLGGIYLMFSF